MKRRAVVAESSWTAAEPRGCKGLVWKRHWPLVSPFLGRSWGWGTFPQMRRHREILYGFPLCTMYAAGSKAEKRAGGPLHGGTIAQSFAFCNGGVAGASDSGVRPPMGTDGFVLARALHQRRVWLGVRRCPTGPPSNVFGNRGTPPVPPAGAAAPAPCLGDGGALPHLPLSTGERTRCACWTGGLVVACALHQRRVWLGLRRCPTGPPSNVFGNRGTPPVPPAGAQPPAPCLER